MQTCSCSVGEALPRCHVLDKTAIHSRVQVAGQDSLALKAGLLKNPVSFVDVALGAGWRSRHQRARGRSCPQDAASSQSPATYHHNPYQCDGSNARFLREGLLLKGVRCLNLKTGHDARSRRIRTLPPQCPDPRRAGLKLRGIEKLTLTSTHVTCKNSP